MTDRARDTYTFGDNDTATARLAWLAAVYEAETRTLVARAAAGRRPALALDLGCGPGHTTRLVHEVTGAARTVGVDASARYLELARAAHPELAFEAGDVAVGLPVAGADFLLARFLLTHLADPHAALAAWARAAAPGARLALHETEELSSTYPALARYYELVGALQAHHGQALHVGARLDALIAGSGWRVIESRAIDHAKPASAMARLHAANLRTWRADPFARETFDPRELDTLEAALTAIAAGAVPAPDVRNVARQIVAERAPT